jgi:uncharacterized protein YecT (DUF1311 family)
MAKAYTEALAVSPTEEKKKLRKSQREWLSIRDRCREPDAAECILQTMDSRRAALWNFIVGKNGKSVQVP